jgi:MFS family permease
VTASHSNRSVDPLARKAFWTTFSGFSIDAMSVQVLAFLLPALSFLWSISPTRAGILASAALASGSIGGWLAGSVSDRVGRIAVLRITILWLGISSALCGLAQTYDQLLLARLVQGFGFGAEWSVGVVFIGEIAPRTARGRTLGSLQSAWAVGWGLAAATTSIALALVPSAVAWRIVFFVGLLPALAIAGLRTRLIEPPIFQAGDAPSPWHRIFSRDARSNTLKGCALATGTHGGYWAIATWWPTMLRLERGLSASATTLHMAVLVGGSFVGYLLAAWLSDRIGRRATLVSFAAAGAVVALAATQLSLSNAALLLLTPVLGLFALGLYSALGPVLTESYPTALRGSGLGFCYNMGRGLAGATPVAVGTSVAALGYAHAIGLYVAMSYTLVVLATATLRETRAVDLVRVAEIGGAEKPNTISAPR